MSSPDARVRDRLLQLIDGRRPYPWGRKLGLTDPTINKMFRDGHLPTARFLTRIQRAENVSLSWLLTGAGNPYLAVSGGPTFVFKALHAVLEDPGPEWSLYIPMTEGQIGLLLYRQVALDKGLEEIVETRIFGGQDLHGTYTEALLGDENLIARSNRPVWAVYLEPEEWLRLTTGWWPNWLLFGDAPVDVPLFGNDYHKVKGSQDLSEAINKYFQTSELAEEAGCYADEQEILSAYHALEHDQRDQALRILKAMRTTAK